MHVKNKEQYSEETLELARHGFIHSSIDRLYILETLKENGQCRVTQLVMETGLSVRQVYYQLQVLRKMNYVTTRFNKGRYLVSLAPGHQRGREMIRTFFNDIFGKEEKPITHLRIVE